MRESALIRLIVDLAVVLQVAGHLLLAVLKTAARVQAHEGLVLLRLARGELGLESDGLR